MFGSIFLNWNTLNPNRCNTESLLAFVSKLQKKTTCLKLHTHSYVFYYFYISVVFILCILVFYRVLRFFKRYFK